MAWILGWFHSMSPCMYGRGKISSMSQFFIDCSEQPLDQSFHSSVELVALGLVDGTIEVHSYPFGRTHSSSDSDRIDDEDKDTIVASIDITHTDKATSKESDTQSCRAVQFSREHTSRVFAACGHTLACYDLEKDSRGQELLDGRLVWSIHDSKHKIQIIRTSTETNSLSHLIFTGDDNGLIRLWDTRLCSSNTIDDDNTSLGCVMSHRYHSDYISGLQSLDNALFSSSADGTWAASDLRKLENKSTLFQSEIMDDDELLSLLAIHGSNKVFCGTNSGIVKAWTPSDTSTGPGSLSGRWVYDLDLKSYLYHHPPHHSIDTIVAMDEDTLLTGCSDGLIRFFSISSQTFLGVLNPTNHGGIDDRCTVQDMSSIDFSSKHIPNKKQIFAGNGYPVEKLDFTIGMDYVVCLSHDNFIRFYCLDDDNDEDSSVDEECDEKHSSDSQSDSDSDHNVSNTSNSRKKPKKDTDSFFDDL